MKQSIVGVLAVICLLAVITSRKPQSVDLSSASSSEVTTKDNSVVSSTISNHDNADADGGCEKVLNAMDARFDHQRDMRNKLLQDTEFLDKALNMKVFGAKKVLYDPYEPEAICATRERFGGEARFAALGHGPKFVCGVDYIKSTSTSSDDNKKCLVYNIMGGNEPTDMKEIDFEQAVSQHIGCEVHTFHPTLGEGNYTGKEYASFHAWGVGTTTASSSKSMSDTMKELGHTGRKIDILKMDCDGCEYAAMASVFETAIEIDQIQIELHLPWKQLDLVKTFFEAADKAGYRIFHKERDHWGKCAGYLCVEYSLAHKSFLRNANADVVCKGHYSKVPTTTSASTQ